MNPSGPTTQAAQPDADAVAAAVLSCPSVSGLSGGIAGEVATYLPGRRVSGVRVSLDAVEVHVIARYGSPLATVASQARTAAQRAASGPDGTLPRVDVVLADVEDPFEP